MPTNPIWGPSPQEAEIERLRAALRRANADREALDVALTTAEAAIERVEVLASQYGGGIAKRIRTALQGETP